MPDPSEKWQILKLTTYAMIATTVIFVLIRLGARGTPKTMSEEWQTAQNEYLRVSLPPAPVTDPPSAILTPSPRDKTPSPSPVSRPRATPARA